jgi:Fe-S cluster biosynthesis and repair protein YggX
VALARRRDAVAGRYPGPDREDSKEKRVTRTVKCVVIGAEAEGLERIPYPGELGKRIYENVSKLAWQRWLKHQTMIINEYRLSPIEPKARAFLEKEMEKFFFGEGSDRPPDYKEPE